VGGGRTTEREIRENRLQPKKVKKRKRIERAGEENRCWIIRDRRRKKKQRREQPRRGMNKKPPVSRS